MVGLFDSGSGAYNPDPLLSSETLGFPIPSDTGNSRFPTPSLTSLALLSSCHGVVSRQIADRLKYFAGTITNV